MQRRTLMMCVSLGAVVSIFGAPAPSYAREAVAVVLGRTIYRDELRAPANELGHFISEPLLLRFVQDHRLTVTPEEIEEFWAGMKRSPLPENLGDADRNQLRKIAEGMVLNWKISRALHQQYGGEVIFQQANPLEPVGAMRLFLEEQERSNEFVIYNTEDRDRFYEYYRRQHPFVVPASEVNYDKPWWRK